MEWILPDTSASIRTLMGFYSISKESSQILEIDLKVNKNPPHIKEIPFKRAYKGEEVRNQIEFLNTTTKTKVNPILQKTIPSTKILQPSKHPLSQTIHNGFHNLHLDGHLRRPGYRNPSWRNPHTCGTTEQKRMVREL
jgi:hypothetical protein